MQKIKIGVIGTGHLGKLHTNFLSKSEFAEFIGVYDSDADLANSVATEFGTKSYESFDKLLDEIDAVSVAATTSAHYKLMKEALEKNVHVFVEKPITSKAKEAEEIVALAESKNLKIQVGHIERFNPAVLAIAKYIDNPTFIQTDRLAQFSTRGTDVAVVLDLMIHDIDLILSFVKSPVKEIKANGVAVVSETYDIANARIEFENGAVANVTASRISQKKMRKMRIFQKDAYLSLDFTTGTPEVYRIVGDKSELAEGHISFGSMGTGTRKKNLIYLQPEIEEINALQYELDLFLKCIINKENPTVSGKDGLEALRVARIIESIIEENQIT
ncbi:MAG: Gfo/Idh/MocA family oxidoreductase [Melioribacteraceae bacterium]|nr:Gfo/Idh/MocA family oxidoreductase [Melioribacteraceae bacterium]MCF8264360.1 Gfo/Idh/MocA family oxidoreductase [Melioribacteraceae bacterium]MCF8413417.1 Gfo/Idh/MocA family oxidoreductase [Melioribacteraceae bacterium]